MTPRNLLFKNTISLFPKIPTFSRLSAHCGRAFSQLIQRSPKSGSQFFCRASSPVVQEVDWFSARKRVIVNGNNVEIMGAQGF
jgi:hypothetical protein